MGKVDDFINGLEGKTDLDPTEIAKTLYQLHKEEIEPVSAKVSQLENSLSEKDQEIANAQSEISKQKAMNYDLTMQLPGQELEDDSTAEHKSGNPNVTIADLFSENVRKRNPLLRKYNA